MFGEIVWVMNERERIVVLKWVYSCTCARAEILPANGLCKKHSDFVPNNTPNFKLKRPVVADI